MYLHGITPAQQQQLLAQLYSLQAQLAAAQQALQVCYASSESGAVCNDGNITGAVASLQSQIAVVQQQLAQPVDYVPPTPSPQPVGPGVPSAVPPSPGGTAPTITTPMGTQALAPVPGASPFSPTDIDVQSVTGNTSALMPGSVPGDTPAEGGGKGWLLLLAAGAAVVLGG